MTDRVVTTVAEFLEAVESDYRAWQTESFPWFRGEPDPEVAPDTLPLLPSVFRPRKDGSTHDENALLQYFRLKAPILGLPIVPETDRTDQWLFVARHVGLPTRLLDWTEGALIALFFALREADQSVVWMLNPQMLNSKATGDGPNPGPNVPTLTWPRPEGNFYAQNIRGAWELDKVGVSLPTAIHPSNIHPRLSAQHSCFTVHGQRKEGLADMVGEETLVRYSVKVPDQREALLQLRRLGISDSTLFPDPSGLARELEFLF